jgi:hypothetical protein
MTEAWFSPETARLFSFLSFLAFCSLFNIPAKQGRLRVVAVAVWNVMIAFAVLMLSAGALAIAGDQPKHVSNTLLLSGFIVGTVFLFTRRGLMRCYREAELRRTVAADL